MDFANCGQSVPCQTIGFILTHRAANNDIIKIENSNLSKPFTIYRSFHILSNITLLGIHGKPVIKTDGPFQPTHLFEETGLQKAKVITLRIKNLLFQRMGIVHVINTSSNISFENCLIENIVASRDIIRIENHHSEVFNGLVYFRKCSFINNVALESTRAISVNQIHSVFHKCYFKDNWSTSNGMLVLAGGINVIKESLFEKNVPVDTYIGAGGAIYATANSTLQILNSTFRRNKALKFGGAVCFLGKRLVVISTLFEYNTAMTNYNRFTIGGAVYAYFDSIVEISNCSFEGNQATFNGGAIFIHGGKLAIRASLFKNNNALSIYNMKTFGGAVCAAINSFVHVLNCYFKGNRATFSGGAISTSGGKLMIISSLFE